MPSPSIRNACILTATLLVSACHTPDPRQEVSLTDLEAYWVVDSPLGDTQRISPAVRFNITSRGAKKTIEALATFRRKGEEQSEWGTGFMPVTQAGKPLALGEKRLVMIVSDSHYTAPTGPEDMMHNAQFTDVHVVVFIRIGPSSWVKLGEIDADRRIGTHALEGH